MPLRKMLARMGFPDAVRAATRQVPYRDLDMEHCYGIQVPDCDLLDANGVVLGAIIDGNKYRGRVGIR